METDVRGYSDSYVFLKKSQMTQPSISYILLLPGLYGYNNIST